MTTTEPKVYPWDRSPQSSTPPPAVAARPWDRPAASPAPSPAHPSPESPAAAWAAYWSGLGLALVPIPRGAKGPEGITGWQTRTFTQDHWRANPEQGMGARLRDSGLASFDGDAIEEARLALAAVGLDLDSLKAGAVIIQGHPARWRALYRLPAGGEGLSRKALTWPPREEGGKPVTIFELRAGPVQDALPPTLHPGTGQPYSLLAAPWELEQWTAPPTALLELWRDWEKWRPVLEAACPWAPPQPEPKATGRERAGGDSVIAAFNAAHDPAAILDAHGYKAKGKNRWLSPSSGSGLAGIVRLSDTGRIFSHHASDPLAGPPHDAFSLFAVLEHQGDTRAAVKAAARLLGMEQDKQDNRPREDADQGWDTDPEWANATPGQAWASPQPMVASPEPAAYPLEALPAAIRAAVEEGEACTKAPLPLVASAAMAALSLVAQPLANVRRAAMLDGPCSLFLLTINDSGERKSSVEGLFMAPIRQWEKDMAKDMRPELKRYQGALKAWQAKGAGIAERIKGLAKANKDTDQAEEELAEHALGMPLPPRVPRLIYQDATPEALAWSLANGWPVGGIVSAEAGTVFGGHAMGKDSIIRALSQLNQLWDAAPLRVDRRTSESFAVNGARVSLSLMIQEPTFRDFLEKSGTLARGSGFLARFLLAWPESTQGTRFYSDPPAGTPALSGFNARLSALLTYPLPLDEDDCLSPPELSLDRDAHASWIAFHDAIEGDLGEGGELRLVRDVASKTADNAARLACLFHLFEHGPVGSIGRDHFDRASRIVAWHLSESRRFFGEIALPPELLNAARLDSWLLAYARREGTTSLSIRDAQRLGPLRDKLRLAEALTTLSELDRARVVKEGRRKVIQINPALVEVAP